MTFDLPTFLFQAVNFLVLVALLWRLLWKPLREHMRGRAERIASGLEEVKHGREQVAESRAEAEEMLEQAERKESDAVRRAEERAEARGHEIIEEARRKAAEERDRRLEQADDERRRREREMIASLGPLVATSLRRLLEEIGEPTRSHEGACERFASYLESLPEERRQSLREAARSAGVELVSARNEVPHRLRRSVGSLFGDVEPRLRTASDLIGGARLEVGEHVLDGSLEAQVQELMMEARA